MSYFTATGATFDWGSQLGQPPATSTVKYTGGSGSEGRDWVDTASGVLQTSLQYLTARQQREQAQAEAQAAASRGMGPVGGMSYTPLILGGIAIAAVILLTRKKS